MRTNPARHPDFGEAELHPTAGAAVVGARKFLIAWNINLRTADVAIAKRIARTIRASSGGLPCVKAMGGFKKVGVLMRPELSADKAGEWLADCLNPDRPQKLSLDQAMFVLRAAREIGCHAGMYFIARDCGYSEPGPVEPEDEAADLERKFIATAEMLAPMLTRIESLRAKARKG